MLQTVGSFTGKVKFDGLKPIACRKHVVRVVDDREAFYHRVIDGTRAAYHNTPDNVWFTEAVRERIVNCDTVLCCYLDTDSYCNGKGYSMVPAGYIGCTEYDVKGVGSVCYIDVATCFPAFQRKGIVNSLFKSLEGFDAVMLRTQNPQMASVMYRAYGGDIEPLFTSPSCKAKLCAAVVGEKSGNYDYEQMISYGVYNGACLTGTVFHSSPAFEYPLYSRINPLAGDAMILVRLFGRNRTEGGF